MSSSQISERFFKKLTVTSLQASYLFRRSREGKSSCNFVEVKLALNDNCTFALKNPCIPLESTSRKSNNKPGIGATAVE
jgi:hypothetical protein